MRFLGPRRRATHPGWPESRPTQLSRVLGLGMAVFGYVSSVRPRRAGGYGEWGPSSFLRRGWVGAGSQAVFGAGGRTRESIGV